MQEDFVVTMNRIVTKFWLGALIVSLLIVIYSYIDSNFSETYPLASYAPWVAVISGLMYFWKRFQLSKFANYQKQNKTQAK